MVLWSVLSNLRPLIHACNTSYSSSIVVMSSTLRTSGSSSSPALCTLARWVRILVLDELATTVRANVVNLAMGIIFNYQTTTAIGRTWTPLPYYSISLSLNILLTLIIVIRLIIHARRTRAALGMAGIGGLYKSIVTMLVESSALYGVSSLLVIVPLAAGANPIVDFSLSVLRETQVRDFPSLQSSGRLPNATMDRIGYRPTAHR